MNGRWRMRRSRVLRALEVMILVIVVVAPQTPSGPSSGVRIVQPVPRGSQSAAPVPSAPVRSGGNPCQARGLWTSVSSSASQPLLVRHRAPSQWLSVPRPRQPPSSPPRGLRPPDQPGLEWGPRATSYRVLRSDDAGGSLHPDSPADRHEPRKQLSRLRRRTYHVVRAVNPNDVPGLGRGIRHYARKLRRTSTRASPLETNGSPSFDAISPDRR